MAHPLVSVIVPNYNSIKFIGETLNSVFNQTCKNLEIIVVDDGSTDGSFEFISNLNNPNLKLVQNTSKGACAARNYGLQLAKGDYIQFLDADDLLDTDKIRAQLELLKNYSDRVAVCSSNHFYENKEQGVIAYTPFLYATDNPHEFLLKLYGADGKNHNMVAQHAWLTPKTVIDKAGLWNEDLIKDQDGEFFCRVVLASNGICYAENVLCHYRKHRQTGNISSGKSKNHLLSQLRALNSKYDQLKSLKDTDAFKAAFSLQYKCLAINAYPEYGNLSDEALKKSKELGGSDYLPVLGGRIIEFLKHAFGWKFAKSFSHWLHNNKIFKSVWHK